MQDLNSTATRVRIPIEQFGRYLRTGLWVRPDDDIELKFNPWHDPKTGRFTFKGGGGEPGTWRGGGFTGGGGGSAGGGGAAGNWGSTETAKTGNATHHKQPDAHPVSVVVRTTANAASTAAPRGHSIARNGYVYTLDGFDRTTSVTGTLTLAATPRRSRSAQTAAGGSDRLATDDGGHYIAARFNGPTDTFNHFAQDANFNRGGYRVLEDKWAKDIKSGKRVYVSITPFYIGSSRRPTKISVAYSINGEPGFRPFSNSSQGKSHAK